MNIFTTIKSRVSIFDVVSEYATLKKAGGYYKGRCPFHHEKTASFTVSPHKEIFYCFGCHLGGDVIAFIAKIENRTPIEAAQFLAERYNIELPAHIEHNDSSNTHDKQRYFDICKATATWCHQQLLKNPTALQYLTERGISRENIDYFSIGLFPGGLANVKNCIAELKQHSILIDDLLESNILVHGKQVLYSPFEDRIMFPIKDQLGRFCAFGGRVYKPQDTRPKYYNSRENDYFVKGSIVFGFDLAKKSIQEQGAVFLVEGYTDCIAMVQHGFHNTVATLGTACTPNHLKQLARYANYVYVLYDGDKAGEQAALRLAHLCWQAHMEMKVIVLPAGQDPASFLFAGNDLTQRIANAQDIFVFFIESLGQGFALKPLAEKVTLTRTLLDTIKTVDDPLTQDILLEKAATILAIPLKTLERELKNTRPAPGNRENNEPVHESEPEESSSPIEKKIFCAIVNNIDLFSGLRDSYALSYMPPSLQNILHKLAASREQSAFDFTVFFDRLNESEKQYVSKLLLEHDEPVLEKSDFEQLLIQFYKKQWKVIVKTITDQLTRAQQVGDIQEVQKILAEFQALKAKIVPAMAQYQPRER